MKRKESKVSRMQRSQASDGFRFQSPHPRSSMWLKANDSSDLGINIVISLVRVSGERENANYAT